MPNFTQESTLSFARQEEGNVTTLALLTLAHENDRFKKELRVALTSAITEWVNTTASGKRAWQESSQDFNVGDLYQDMEEPELTNILLAHGLKITRMVLVEEGAVESFDTVLVNTDKLT